MSFCVLNRKENIIIEKSEELYQSLTKQGLEVLMDDRDEKPGSQFADADLMGIPFRIILSPKTYAEGCVELKYRDNRSEPRKVKLEETENILLSEIKDEYRKYNSL